MGSFFATNIKLYNFQPNFFLYNQPLTIDKHPKYLGFVLNPEILGNKHINNIAFKARKRLIILRYISGSDRGADAGTMRNTYISLIRSILEYGVPLYCSTSITNFQKLKKVQLSAAWIITGLKSTCFRDIVFFDEDLQPLNLRRRAYLIKYYNKLRSLDCRNHTSAYFKDSEEIVPSAKWSLLTLPIGAVDPHHLSQCLDPGDDLDGVFFHPELPVYVNKQADLPAYLKQLALGRIADIPTDVVQVYADGSRDDFYRSGSSRIYIKSQDHTLRIQRRNSDGCPFFAHQIHLQWIPSHIDLEGNEIADTLAKAGACKVPEPSVPLTFWRFSLELNTSIRPLGLPLPRAPLVSVFSSLRLSGSRSYKTGSNSSSPFSKWPYKNNEIFQRKQEL
ncbi:RNase H domain-containing protein [Trichonephila clavipes]|nr:RNase H domain-containing protein [Trichonephila clavipes]